MLSILSTFYEIQYLIHLLRSSQALDNCIKTFLEQMRKLVPSSQLFLKKGPSDSVIFHVPSSLHSSRKTNQIN